MKILALVLAGGKGSRLYPLTARDAKPALPFMNGYRIIDFVLSNLVNSGVSSIYVIVQYKPQSLIEHLNTAWADRFDGNADSFLSVVRPKTDGGEIPFQGTADAVYRCRHLIERHRPDLVAVFAADHVYRMDVRRMTDFHRRRNADVTVAAVAVPIETASAFGVIDAGRDGDIREFQEKPARPTATPADPTRAYASMGNYLFDPQVLVHLLEDANRSGGSDFGLHILPRLPGRYRTFAYDFLSNVLPGVAPHEEPGYWRDVGTPEALVAARNDTLGARPRFALYNREWPIWGRERALRSARNYGGSRETAAENAATRYTESMFPASIPSRASSTSMLTPSLAAPPVGRDA
jgi:glucose-1-phosphate adenylyltransferase